jgi:hypothetical protein
VPSLSQARDLGIVRCVPGDGALELNAFKPLGAIPERVQTTRASRSGSETEGQVTGSDESSAPTMLALALALVLTLIVWPHRASATSASTEAGR